MGVRRGKMLKPIDSKGKNTAPYRVPKHFDFPREIGWKRREMAEKRGFSLNLLILLRKAGKTRFSKFSIKPVDFLRKTSGFGGLQPPLVFLWQKRREKENICECVGRLGFAMP